MTLPDGWIETTLGEIAQLVGGGTPSRENPDYFTGDIVWLTPTEIPKDRIVIIEDSKEKITKDGLAKSSARIVPKGTVLMTSRASIGFVAIAGTEVTTNQGFASFICQDRVLNRYLAYWLWANAENFKQVATGTTFKEITKSKLRMFSFPLPTLPEQERIVERIESLFSRLDAGVVALKRAQAALKRYRASVLKAACEGRLVPQDPEDEPAGELLKRILVEKSTKAGDLPVGLADLPAGWCWAKLSSLVEKIADVDHRMPKPANTDIAYVSTRDFVDNDDIDYEGAKKISLQDYDSLSRKVKPEKNDILLSRYGTIGEVRKLKTDRSIQASYSIAILKTFKSIDITDFLILALRSDIVQKQIKRDVRATAQPDLGLAHIREFLIPTPPLDEQRRILSEVEARFSVMDEMALTLSVSLARSARLRQSILKRAFEGRLVHRNQS